MLQVILFLVIIWNQFPYEKIWKSNIHGKRKYFLSECFVCILKELLKVVDLRPRVGVGDRIIIIVIIKYKDINVKIIKF